MNASEQGGAFKGCCLGVTAALQGGAQEGEAVCEPGGMKGRYVMGGAALGEGNQGGASRGRGGKGSSQTQRKGGR